LISVNKPPEVLTVSKLTRRIQGIFESSFGIVWIEGEISNFRAPASGHYYMVLKDEKAQIRTVMFRSQAQGLKFIPKDGMMVIGRGKIGVYAPRGEYQIILDYLEPLGIGAFSLAFEQLKQKLAARGVFAQEIKKPLPFLPQKVAVITSPTGAAIRDFLKIINRRFANIEIVVVPVRVQGEDAATDMVRAIDKVNQTLDVDVIVLTRGGGSIEDLWAFNAEELAMAIRRSKIPVVSAVGHEIDLTISDLAADFRAPTPSAAAELLVEEKEGLLKRLKEIRSRLVSTISQVINSRKYELDHYTKRLRNPKRTITDHLMRLDELHSQLVRLINLGINSRLNAIEHERRTLRLNSPAKLINSMNQKIEFHRHTILQSMSRRLNELQAPVRMLEKRIHDLAPVSVLNRGYSVVQKLPEKTSLRDTSSVKERDRVRIILSKGELGCIIEKITDSNT